MVVLVYTCDACGRETKQAPSWFAEGVLTDWTPCKHCDGIALLSFVDDDGVAKHAITAQGRIVRLERED